MIMGYGLNPQRLLQNSTNKELPKAELENRKMKTVGECIELLCKGGFQRLEEKAHLLVNLLWIFVYT